MRVKVWKVVSIEIEVLLPLIRAFLISLSLLLEGKYVRRLQQVYSLAFRLAKWFSKGIVSFFPNWASQSTR